MSLRLLRWVIFLVLSFPETAMNIGYSCNLLYDDMDDVFVIDGSTSDDVLTELR